ncbi:hypothetical protein WJX84_011435 [Apatococcus fuscideae]|uniref:Uncharacterized protein n=1 Tax=Apatococcus fuscideae TaxID=2026836 RepID=A0AAW1TJS6_9CHLO
MHLIANTPQAIHVQGQAPGIRWRLMQAAGVKRQRRPMQPSNHVKIQQSPSFRPLQQGILRNQARTSAPLSISCWMRQTA